MEYLCPSGDARHDRALLRSDLEVLAAVSMQAHGSLGMLGRKFIMGFKFHVRMGEADVRASKDYGAKGLLKRCGDWALADDGEAIVIPK